MTLLSHKLINKTYIKTNIQDFDGLYKNVSNIELQFSFYKFKLLTAETYPPNKYSDRKTDKLYNFAWQRH